MAERRTGLVELGPFRVPVAEIVGRADGPLVTLLAGVHGCEYAAIAAVRELIEALPAEELAGRVRAVPVLNVSAFAQRVPFVVPEDGKNLNRVVAAGLPGGRAGARRAAAGRGEHPAGGAAADHPVAGGRGGLFLTTSPAVAAGGLLAGVGRG